MNSGEFNKWEVKLDQNAHNLVGYVHQPPMLLNGTETRRWDDYTGRKLKHAEPTKLARDKWTIIYGDQDYDNANKCLDELRNASKAFGISVEEPYWCEIDGREAKQKNGKGFTDYLQRKDGPLSNPLDFALVIIFDPKNKKAIKSLLDKAGVPSQFVLSNTLKRAKITVFSNILKQINAKLRGDLYKIEPKNAINTMVVGCDIVAAGRDAVIGLTASYSKHMTQHYSKVVR